MKLKRARPSIPTENRNESNTLVVFGGNRFKHLSCLFILTVIQGNQPVLVNEGKFCRKEFQLIMGRMAGYFATPNGIIDSGKNHISGESVRWKGNFTLEGSGFYQLNTSVSHMVNCRRYLLTVSQEIIVNFVWHCGYITKGPFLRNLILK